MLKKKGFTLIELLVVIFIIGLLASIVIVSVNSARSKARDTKRKADLNQLKGAVERYNDDNGQYPTTAGAWYSYCSAWTPTAVNDWIPGIVPTYLPALPLDPKRGTNISTNLLAPDGSVTSLYTYCYLYRSDGRDYKIAAHCAPETAAAPVGDPFYKGSAAWACGNYNLAVYTAGAITW